MQSQYSQSSSCLQRVIPITIWGRFLTNEELYEAIKLIIMMTHPNYESIEVSFTYALLLRHLLYAPEDIAGALNIVDKYTENIPFLKQLID